MVVHYVPTGKTASYKAANIWKSFGTVKDDSWHNLATDATLAPANATSQIIWTSSDTHAATVSGTGAVTAKDAGTFIITASGIEKMVLSLLSDFTFYGKSNYSWHDDNINAYQIFDNLSPDENGIYHISWEIKDMQGKFFDIYKMRFKYTIDPEQVDNNSGLGLYVEGDEQETFNLGIPEYGGQYGGGLLLEISLFPVASI